MIIHQQERQRTLLRPLVLIINSLLSSSRIEFSIELKNEATKYVLYMIPKTEFTFLTEIERNDLVFSKSELYLFHSHNDNSLLPKLVLKE